jgi:hypothetical protein
MQSETRYSDPMRTIGWKNIANQVKTRSWKQCLDRWYNHLKHAKEPFGTKKCEKWTRDDHLSLLKRLKLFRATEESEIDWVGISKSTAHETWGRKRSANDLRVEWNRLKAKVPNRYNMTFSGN